MAKERIIMDEATKQLLSSRQHMPRHIDLRGRKYYTNEFISGKGYKSVVWRGVDEYDSPVAIKFATYEDYMDSSYLQEVSRAAKLRKYPQFFAHFYDAGIIELKLPGERQEKLVCFIEEWIDGQILEEYARGNEITPAFIVNYVSGMCNALNILRELNLRHDDLHLGNVMIENPKKGALSKQLTVKVIDYGSLKPYDAPLSETKDKDDHGWFTEHLRFLCNRMLSNPDNQRKPLSIMRVGRIWRRMRKRSMGKDERDSDGVGR